MGFYTNIEHCQWKPKQNSILWRFLPFPLTYRAKKVLKGGFSINAYIFLLIYNKVFKKELHFLIFDFGFLVFEQSAIFLSQ